MMGRLLPRETGAGVAGPATENSDGSGFLTGQPRSQTSANDPDDDIPSDVDGDIASQPESDNDDEPLTDLELNNEGAVKNMDPTAYSYKYLDEDALIYWLNVSAVDAGNIMVECGLLGARYTIRHEANEDFVALVKDVIRDLRQVHSDCKHITIEAQIIFDCSSDEEWAREIEMHTPEAVKEFILQKEPPYPHQSKRLPRVNSTDFGVYACFLLALDKSVHDHLYVGSGTGPRGIWKRMHDRDRRPTERWSLLDRLLWDGKPREEIWVTLFHIQGSQLAHNPTLRTHFRFVSLLAEMVFHDMLNSWRGEKRDHLSRWARLGRPAVRWWGMNSAHPLTAPWITFAAFPHGLAKLRQEGTTDNRDPNLPASKGKAKLSAADNGLTIAEWLSGPKAWDLALRRQRWAAMPLEERKAVSKRNMERQRIRDLEAGVGLPNKGPFTPEEDELLIEIGAGQVDGYSWGRISDLFQLHFAWRTPSALQSRHRNSMLAKEKGRTAMSVQQRANDFTSEEDAFLVQLKTDNDSLRWEQIGHLFRQRFAGREPTSLKNRYCDIVRAQRRAGAGPPKRKVFTAEEDKYLFELKERGGNRPWAEIAEIFGERYGPRKPDALRSRYWAKKKGL